MKMTKIISYIHLLGCVGWLIFPIFVFIMMIKDNELPRNKMEAFIFLAFFSAVYATALSGIDLVVAGHKKQPENIKRPTVILITKIIHILGCIGWSIFGLVVLIVGLSAGERINILVLFAFFALFATTASGISLYEGRRQGLVQLWKIKKLIILWAGTFVIVAMCLFPPMGYAFLFSDYGDAHIDSIRLIIQCGIVGLITGTLLYTLKDKKS
jgi:hypothetical protein